MTTSLLYLLRCQQCARRQLLKVNHIIRKPFADYALHCPNPACKKKTSGDLVILEPKELKSSNENTCRTRNAQHCYENSFIRFRENLELENMLKNSSPLLYGRVQDYNMEWECILCRSNIVYGNSVLLMCGCFNIPVCQICIRNNLAYWKAGGNGKFYEQGIACIVCKSCTPVDNISATKKEAKRLVQQGSRELMGNQKNSQPSGDAMHSLLCKYYSLNIKGTISLEEYPSHKFENYSKDAFVLELARMETRRCQPELYSREDTLPLGPLSLLKVKTNPLLERFLVNTSTVYMERGSSFRSEYPDWYSVKDSGEIIPLVPDMATLLQHSTESKNAQEFAAMQYRARQAKTIPAIDHIQLPSAALVSEAVQLEFVEPNIGFEKLCSCISDQLRNRFDDSSAAIITSYFKPQDIAEYLPQDQQRTALDNITAAEVLAKVNAEVEELAELYLPDLKICADEGVGAVDQDEQEEEQLSDSDEGEEGEACTTDDQEFKETIQGLPAFETAAMTDAMVVGDEDMATSNVTATAYTASSTSCEEPLIQRAVFEALDLSSLGPFVAILEMQSSTEGPAQGSTNNQGDQSSDSSLWIRSRRDQAQRGGGGAHGADVYKGDLRFLVSVLLPDGTYRCPVQLRSNKLSLTALANEIECELHLGQEIEQVCVPNLENIPAVLSIK